MSVNNTDSCLQAPPAYAELHCLSNFSFLRAASFPEELVERAIVLGYRGLAITDECSMAGVVRAHMAIRAAGERARDFTLIIGSEFTSAQQVQLVLLARNRRGYGQICAVITESRRQAVKGEYHLDLHQLLEAELSDVLVLWVPSQHVENFNTFEQQSLQTLQQLNAVFTKRLWIAAELFLLTGDDTKKVALQRLSERTGVPVCAAGGVQMHMPQRRALRDTVTAIRLGKAIADLGFDLPANGQQYLRSRRMLARIFPAQWLDQTLSIAAQCQFSLDELRYEYPRELVPHSYTSTSWLRKLTLEGMQQRWPEGAPESVQQLVNKELKLISELAYEHFFLTVHDIVVFARSQGIFCQGRGSAANSAVCYCLGITAVDPARMQLLFERFLSKERNEPPDIDVDFEHERREEVIQYVYKKYGRQRAALAATVICYRRRSAIRDVGKALGLTHDQIERCVSCLRMNSDGKVVQIESPDLESRALQQLIDLVEQLCGFPRHLSQHVGGFVISEGPLHELVPVENAAMADRTVIQWEKDDLEALGLLKVDILALGMLTVVRKALALLPPRQGKTWQLQDVPAEDPQVYEMISRADTVGVFQIESRAQMSMLPRLKPRNYYDLVIQIAIVRPGPIQGDMVHPYLARRQGKEPVVYPSEGVRSVLERTLGVPIFQEQVMQIAMVAAGFSGGESDQLRRAMAAWKRKGGLEPFEEKLISGMRARGYSESFARQIYQQIRGFGDYGFPESHSASFALLAYVSAWLKCHYPAAFVCALINSQPMGFYAPAQLVQDLRRHGVLVLPVDVRVSQWDCTLENKALRLGLRLVKGLSSTAAQQLLNAREQAEFVSVADLVRRAGLNQRDRDALAAADALSALATDRHRAFWDASAVEIVPPLFAAVSDDFGQDRSGAEFMLPRPDEAQNILADYNHTGLSLRRHPLALWRRHLTDYRVSSAERLEQLADGDVVKVAGLITCRQRPQTASGVTFLTLEDETGFINVVVWPSLLAHYYRQVHEASVMGITGKLQRADGVTHVIATVLVDLSHWFAGMSLQSRDFS
ncbi:DNA polymerase III subunit alpha [Gammaproteobacteria bacterium LSUCC0112]|nr:DNA polymerase III subunit alpha [Gammaproteobacteria bacterium LSUCC0112]